MEFITPEIPGPQRVLLVDDDEELIALMIEAMRHYSVELETALDGEDALLKAKNLRPDLIYLDIVLPGMDGYEVCDRLKKDPLTQNVPIIFITALSDREARMKGFRYGAIDYIAKPLDISELIVRTGNLLKLKQYEKFLEGYNDHLVNEVAKRTSEIEKSRQIVTESYLDTIHRLTIVAEFKDEDTAVHIKRVGEYCASLARRLGWSEEKIDAIHYASPMHDIGKVGIPADILLKPARLSPEEMSLMKTHTTIGGKILSGSGSRYLQMAEEIALSHHENWDGTGYPRGLKGEEIPAAGRVMNIVDQYDALRSPRPYKASHDHKTTLKILTEGDGRTMPYHFYPAVLNAFKDVHGRFEEIFESMKDFS